jgi:hypothetical protein
MGLDDLFKRAGSHGHHHHDHDDRHHGHDQDRYYRDGRSGEHRGIEDVRGILRALPNKKVLIITMAIIALSVIVLGGVLLWALFPFVAKGLAYVKQDGVQGLLNQIVPVLQGIWKGSGTGS